MTINFIPNDPKVIAKIPMRVVTPRAIRPANRARINVDGPEPEGEHAPGTPEFLFWQCREAALLALEAWEEVDGPFTAWQDGPMLDVFPNDGVDLNAFYDRPRGGLSERVSFFNQTDRKSVV